MKVKLPSILQSASTKVDGSVKLTFETREMGGQDIATLFSLAHSEGWLLFSRNNDLEEVDIPDEKADSMTGQKTQAQRMRAVIYKIWEQAGSSGSFETYYKSYMEKIIDQLKEKLQ